jgi:hypothetical protein
MRVEIPLSLLEVYTCVGNKTPMPRTSTNADSSGVKVPSIGIGLIDGPVIRACRFLDMVTSLLSNVKPKDSKTHLLDLCSFFKVLYIWPLLHHVSLSV